MPRTKETIWKGSALHRQLSAEARRAEVAHTEPGNFVLLLEGEYKHRIMEVLSFRWYNYVAMVCVKTICSAGHELEVRESALQHLPHGRRADVQASVLGRGVGNIQAAFVTSKELGGVMLVSLAPDYNALMHSDMRMKTTMDDEVMHGAVVIGPLGRELRTVSKGGGKRKDYQQKFLLPFHEPKPLLVKVRDGVFVYAGPWELSGEYVVTHDKESAGVEQNHEDFGSLATGFQTKHYQLVYRGLWRPVEDAEDAEQDGEDEGVSCIDLTRRTASPMAVEGAKQSAAAERAVARAVARQLGGGEGGRRGATQPSQEQGSCGTPGCKYADFHLGPCSNWGADNGGERKRRRSSSGEGMAAKAAKAAEVKEVKAAEAAKKATAKLLQEQEEKAAAEEHASAAVPTEASSSLQASSNCPLVCPVSLEHMQDPVALPCGHAFERSAIESHLTTSRDCPVCRRRVPRGEITFGTATMIRDLTRAIEADPAFAKTLGCRCGESE